MPASRLDIWSDIACPWCYIGKRRLERALAQFAAADALAIRWRAFELNPSAPPTAPMSGTYAERLAGKYAMSVDEGQRMVDDITASAEAEGLAYDFGAIQPGNTFDAHRLIALASEAGAGDAMGERLMRAYLCEGESLGDRATLARLAGEVGLAAEAVASMLAGEGFADSVRADREAAVARGIRSAPTFVADDRIALAGAQPPEALLAFLEYEAP